MPLKTFGVMNTFFNALLSIRAFWRLEELDIIFYFIMLSILIIFICFTIKNRLLVQFKFRQFFSHIFELIFSSNIEEIMNVGKEIDIYLWEKEEDNTIDVVSRSKIKHIDASNCFEECFKWSEENNVEQDKLFFRRLHQSSSNNSFTKTIEHIRFLCGRLVLVLLFYYFFSLYLYNFLCVAFCYKWINKSVTKRTAFLLRCKKCSLLNHSLYWITTVIIFLNSDIRLWTERKRSQTRSRRRIACAAGIVP